MPLSRRFDLTGKIRKLGSIQILSVETSSTATEPLVILHYAENGDEQPYGLRLDLDKRVLLDHVDDDANEKALCEEVDKIVSTVFKVISHDEFAE